MSNPLDYLKAPGQAQFKDSEITKFGEIIESWEGQPKEGYGLIGLPLSKPSISHSGASFAPDVIRAVFRNMATYAIESDVDFKGRPIYDFGDVQMHVTDLLASHSRIQDSIYEVVRHNPNIVPIILGGDHSVTCPAFTGYSRAKDCTVGIIQFDAHHDLRNRRDGGPSNGTPFRGLIEGGVLNPEHLIQIGIRNFSNSKAYTTYAKQQGITIYTMRDVRQRGIQVLAEEAYSNLKDKVDEIYLSVDIDVIDQAFAPGCPAIGPGGMFPDDLFEALEFLGEKSLTKAIDIVEIDPKQDFRDMTSRIGVLAFLSFMIGKERVKQN